MLENLYMLFFFILLIILHWFMLCYLADGGKGSPVLKNSHLFRNFEPKHKFLRIYIVGQRKMDMSSGVRRRSGKLSCIGLIGALIATAAAVFVIPLTVYHYLNDNRNLAMIVISAWLAFTLIWSVLSSVLYAVFVLFAKLRK